jgi:ADP-ribosyl-[dinitrogen reductase] hydrolase
MIPLLERYTGSMLGLAVGDALGTTVEFKQPGQFEPVTDMVGGGVYSLQPGQWTDDTSMALCLAESLVESRGFDPADQMRRYLLYYREGYLSVKGYCFDIGGTVRAALEAFERTANPYSGLTDPYSAGNGSLMRLAPVPLFFATDPRQAIHFAGESSRTTHAVPVAVDACRYMAGLIVGALLGEDKQTLLSDSYSPVQNLWQDYPLAEEIAAIARGSFKLRHPPGIRGSGYVVHALEAALWAFYNSKSFQEGCLMVVNLGEDADTSGAIYGQLAGAFYGEMGIPQSWRERLAWRDRIQGYARRIFEIAQGKR